MAQQPKGKPVLSFRVWYVGDWFDGERDQIVFANDPEHALRVFQEWAYKSFGGHSWEAVRID